METPSGCHTRPVGRSPCLRPGGRAQSGRPLSLCPAGNITVFKQTSTHLQMATTFGLELVVQLQPVFQAYITVGPQFRGQTRGESPPGLTSRETKGPHRDSGGPAGPAPQGCG